MDAASEAVAQEAGAGGPASVLVGNVVLHTGARIDLQLPGVDGPAEALVILARVFAIGVAQGVVDVLLGTIDAQAFFSDFKLLSRIPVCQERENPDLRRVSGG